MSRKLQDLLLQFGFEWENRVFVSGSHDDECSCKVFCKALFLKCRLGKERGAKEQGKSNIFWNFYCLRLSRDSVPDRSDIGCRLHGSSKRCHILVVLVVSEVSWKRAWVTESLDRCLRNVADMPLQQVLI